MPTRDKSQLIHELIPYIIAHLQSAAVPRLIERYLAEDDSDKELLPTVGERLVQSHFNATATVIANRLASVGVFTKDDLSGFSDERQLTSLSTRTGITRRWLSLLTESQAGPESDRPTTVFIVDDHPMFRDSVRVQLEAEEDFRIIGEAATGPEALAKIRRFQPDVAVIDIGLPGMNGLEVTSALRSEQTITRILLFTAYDDEKQMVQSFQRGAFGYISRAHC